MAPRSPSEVNRYFGGTCLHLQVKNNPNQELATNRAACCPLHNGFLLRLFLEPEDRSDVFLRKLGSLLRTHWLTNSVALVRKRTVPSYRRLLAKLVSSFADRRVSRGESEGSLGRILGSLDRTLLETTRPYMPESRTISLRSLQPYWKMLWEFSVALIGSCEWVCWLGIREDSQHSMLWMW
jgi:hypothetical protein